MPVTRRRITLPGVKPIQQQRPAYQSYYLYGAVEPETGERFLLERESLDSDGFQDFLGRLRGSLLREPQYLDFGQRAVP